MVVLWGITRWVKFRCSIVDEIATRETTASRCAGADLGDLCEGAAFRQALGFLSRERDTFCLPSSLRAHHGGSGQGVPRLFSVHPKRLSPKPETRRSSSRGESFHKAQIHQTESCEDDEGATPLSLAVIRATRGGIPQPMSAETERTGGVGRGAARLWRGGFR